MNMFRTTARVGLAAFTLGFGATLATAADKKPNKPAAPPVVKKPNGWSLGASNPTIKSPRDAASGLPTGRTKQPEQARPSVTAPKVELKNAKPINNGGGGVSAQNDAGTRSGTSLTVEGVVDMVKGVGKFLSPKGNTHEGMEQTAKGWAKVKTGTNGDPSDNGDKLTEEGKGGGENNGGNNNNGGSGGSSSSGGGSGGSGT